MFDESTWLLSSDGVIVLGGKLSGIKVLSVLQVVCVQNKSSYRIYLGFDVAAEQSSITELNVADFVLIFRLSKLKVNSLFRTVRAQTGQGAQPKLSEVFQPTR